MALINCPECGRQVSDTANKCPGCGYPVFEKLTENQNTSNRNKNLRYIVVVLIVVALVVVGIIVFVNKDGTTKQSYKYDYSKDYSNYQYSRNTTYDSGRDSSSIFRNLTITDFSCKSGKYAGTMSCQVRNNNTFTVHGYFYVNFYGLGSKLLYSQLMYLPNVAPGETVVCSSSIPKSNYPHDYTSVKFTQATLVESH